MSQTSRRKNFSRSELFNIFSKNLNLVNSAIQDTFMCPLCYELFSRDKVDSLLSYAHIWPESLNGKLKTLACKACNNTIGTSIESHLIRSLINPLKVRLLPFEGSKDSLGVKMDMPDENTINIEVIPKISNPKVIDWRITDGQPFTMSIKETFQKSRVGNAPRKPSTL